MASHTSHSAYCSVDGCNANIHQGNISFFRCPRDPARCELWKKVLGFTGEHRYAELTSELAFKRIRVCSTHFDDKSFTASRKRLLNTAVPSKLLLPMASQLADIFDNANQDGVVSSNVNLEIPSTSSATSCGPCSCCRLRSIDVVKSDASMQTVTFQGFIEDSSGQTASNLSRNTPRKQKLIKEKSQLHNTIGAPRNKKKITREQVFQFLYEKYSQEGAMLIIPLLLLLNNKSKGDR